MTKGNAERVPEYEDRDTAPEIEFDEMPTTEIPAGRERFEELREEQAILDKTAVKEVLDDITTRYEQPVASPPAAARIDAYIEQSVPDYLRDKTGHESLAARLYGLFTSVEDMKEAREALPKEGPFLVVANHSGGESGIILSLLKEYDAHLAAGEELNFNRSGFRKWLLKKMRMIPVRESLANLNETEKEELLERVPGEERKKAYRKIVDREKDGGASMNKDFIRSSVALLLRGDVVAMFPEGLFLYDDNKGLRKAYGGVELIASEYKRLSGKDLPIVPVSVWKNEEGKKIEVGEAMTVRRDDKQSSGTESIMRALAELLPEELKGAYDEEI